MYVAEGDDQHCKTLNSISGPFAQASEFIAIGVLFSTTPACPPTILGIGVTLAYNKMLAYIKPLNDLGESHHYTWFQAAAWLCGRRNRATRTKQHQHFTQSS